MNTNQIGTFEGPASRTTAITNLSLYRIPRSILRLLLSPSPFRRQKPPGPKFHPLNPNPLSSSRYLLRPFREKGRGSVTRGVFCLDLGIRGAKTTVREGERFVGGFCAGSDRSDRTRSWKPGVKEWNSERTACRIEDIFYKALLNNA